MSAGEGVRAALDAHRLVINYGNPRCSCGRYVVPNPDATAAECRAEHDAHLAAVLAPLLDEAAADGWDEGWAACSEWWHANAAGTPDVTVAINPHRARREDAT